MFFSDTRKPRHRFDGQRIKVDVLAAGNDGLKHRVRPRCDQNQHIGRRRFFQHFQKGIGGFLIHSIGIINNKSSFGLQRPAGGSLLNLTDGSDADELGLGFHKKNIRMTGMLNFAAGRTGIAGIMQVIRTYAIDGLDEFHSQRFLPVAEGPLKR